MKTYYSLLLLSISVCPLNWTIVAAENIRVLVWDEQQPAQKQAYTNFLGNEIASYLKQRSGLTISSARLDDPEQGLSTQTLDNCDVLIWWGHARQKEIASSTGRE